MLTALVLLVIGSAIVFFVHKQNKQTFARPIKKITDIADVNNDGKVNLEDIKKVAATVTTETKQVVESAKINAKKTVTKVKKTAGRKKKNS